MAIYFLTDPIRRNAWHAYLAGIGHAASSRRNDAVCSELLFDHFLASSSEQLIVEAFGSCPQGYLAVLKRFPAKAERDVSVFRALHHLLTEHPQLSSELCNERLVSAELVQLLIKLPAALRTVRIADAFDHKSRTYADFMVAYRALTESDDLAERDVASLLTGERPANLLQRVYHAIPFPEPFLPNNDRVQYLNDGAAIVEAARCFQNCLVNWTGEAHRNEQQYYQVMLADGAVAILALKNDAPGGWLMEDVKLAGNAQPDQALVDELCDYLGHLGVRVGAPIASLVRRLGLNADDEIDPFDLDEHLFAEVGVVL